MSELKEVVVVSGVRLPVGKLWRKSEKYSCN